MIREERARYIGQPCFARNSISVHRSQIKPVIARVAVSRARHSMRLHALLQRVVIYWIAPSTAVRTDPTVEIKSRYV